MQLEPPATLRREDDPLAVGRPRREAIGHLRRCADRAHGAGLDVGDADLALAQVLAHPEDVGDLAAVGRDRSAPLVAVIGAIDGQPARKRVGNVDDSQARGLVVALDGDDEARVVDPDRRRALDELARRTASERHDPDETLIAVRDGRAVGRQLRRNVLPERRGLAAGRESSRRGVVERHGPDVGGVRAVLDEDQRAAVGTDREAARALRHGHRFKAPVRRRSEVLARRGGNALVLVLADPHAAIHGLDPPRLRSAQRRPDRRAWQHRTRPPEPPRSERRACRCSDQPRGSRRV